jgi:chemotaxis protein methyltransferase WspC
MSLANFERLLKEMVGLDAAAIGSSTIERAVKERQSAGKLDSLAYWESLQGSETERQLLVEAVVVPETWFFRDRGAFDGLSHFAASWSRSARPDGVLRILSVPCSSGEEPYSIAMSLHEAGLLFHQYRIDAVDVSHKAIARGRQGMYGENSFRGNHIMVRDRYFSRAENGFQLVDEIRGQVRFQQGNVVSSTFLAGAGPYDAIFCRNLFIYFDRPTQRRAIAALAHLLAAEGLLFVGSSETGVFMDQAFAPANLPKAFAFQRKAHEAPPAAGRQAGAAPVIVQQSALAARAKARPAPAVAPARPQPKRQPPTLQPAAAMEKAYQLADQGLFAEAARLCDDCLRREGPSAPAFHLLGLVRDATGEEADAESFYRKALYLDPGHREALAHLALLVDRKGDPSGAQVLRNRLRRLEAVSGPKE